MVTSIMINVFPNPCIPFSFHIGFGDDYDGDYDNDNFVEYPIYDEYADQYADPYSEYDLDPSHYQQGAIAEQE